MKWLGQRVHAGTDSVFESLTLTGLHANATRTKMKHKSFDADCFALKEYFMGPPQGTDVHHRFNRGGIGPLFEDLKGNLKKGRRNKKV
jgi:hypothetical protein